MYNERYTEKQESFTGRDIVIQFLFVALFVFILFWLFPTKSYLDEKLGGLDLDVEIANQSNFADNVDRMRDAAVNYFTNERLPQEIGKTVKITLGEMLNRKLVLPMLDQDGNACNPDASYVEVTKASTEEYIMKVFLSCDGIEDYIIVHLGCYDYCEADVCEKAVPNGTKPTDSTKPTPKPTPTPTPNPNPTPTPSTLYDYEYKKVEEDERIVWGNWTNWSTNSVSSTKLREVQTRNVETTKTEYVKTLHSYKNEIIQETREVVIGEKGTLSCNEWASSSTRTTYEAWYYVGERLLSYRPADTSTRFFVRTSVAEDGYDCDENNCTVKKAYYKEYEKRTTTVTSATSEKVCVSYSLTRTPVYGNRAITYVERTPVYVDVPKEVTSTVKQYRYRLGKVEVDTDTTIKWSTSRTDTTLLNQGFKLTGNSRTRS